MSARMSLDDLTQPEVSFHHLAQTQFIPSTSEELSQAIADLVPKVTKSTRVVAVNLDLKNDNDDDLYIG